VIYDHVSAFRACQNSLYPSYLTENYLASSQKPRQKEIMRGYFGIGVDRISKPMNVGNLFRSAHSFGASFLFLVEPAYERKPEEAAAVKDALTQEIGLEATNDPQPPLVVPTRQIRKSDTSRSADHMPLWVYPHAEGLHLPTDCSLVGVELTEDAVDLPSFRHPTKAAYIFGPERGNLSDDLLARCDHVVKIPMKFCVNVGVAGAILMYDRMLCMGRFAERPVRPGGPLEAVQRSRHGGPRLRREGPDR